MNPQACYPIVVVAMCLFPLECSAATTLGANDDGKPSVAYVVSTGEMIIVPDSVPIGVFDFQSAAGIFLANANFPPLGLIPVIDTPSEKGWGTQSINAFSTNFSLGPIAPTGLSLSFVLGDFSLNGNSGFGTPTLTFDLIYLIPEPGTLGIFCCGGALMIALYRPRCRADLGHGPHCLGQP